MTASFAIVCPHSHPAPLRTKKNAAIADAKNRAAHLAARFDAVLGRVYSLQSMPKPESFHIGGAASMASESEATFEPGLIEFEAKVAVCYYLER